MKAMLLAAGRGERMAALTKHQPKPLLRIGDRTLLDRQLDTLVAAGIEDVVINVSYRGDMIKDAVARRETPRVKWSEEPEALETAGGIVQALPLLGDEFLVLNADVVTDFDPADLILAPNQLATLAMVPNPEHHPDGDFGVLDGVLTDRSPKYTYAGIARFSKALFEGLSPGFRRLRDVLRPAIRDGHIGGLVHEGFWLDVGTPARLEAARRHFTA